MKGKGRRGWNPDATALSGGWRRRGPPDERSAGEHGGGERRQDPPVSRERQAADEEQIVFWGLTPFQTPVYADWAMKALLKIVAAGIVLLASCQVVSEGNRIDLPEPTLRGMSVEEALASRRSVRSYSADSLSLLELSQLLFAAQGVTGARGKVGLRTAPSAGATYPMETYVFVNRIGGLEPGVYHYLPQDHAIELLKTGAYGDSLSEACLGQSMPREAALSVVIAAVPTRTTASYGARGIRYIHMEAGHISQNICLEATSLGMGAVPIGAFDDEHVNRLVGADGEHEISLYVNSIGKMEGKRGDHN